MKREAPVIVEEVKQDQKTKQSEPPKVEKREVKKPEKKGWLSNLFSKEKSEPPKKPQVDPVPQHSQQQAEEKPFMSMEEMIAADMMAMGEEPQPQKTQTKPAKPEAIPAPERKIIEKPEPLLKAKEPVFTKPEPIVVKPDPVFAKACLEPTNFDLTE